MSDDNDIGDRGPWAVAPGCRRFRAYQSQLLALARQAGIPSSDVEDVLQEVWLAVSRKREGQQPGSAPVRRWRAWLRKVLADKVADFFRRRNRHPTCSLGSMLEPAREPGRSRDDPAVGLEPRDWFEHVRGALEALRRQGHALDMRILELRRFEGRDAAEVAELLGLSRRQVAKRLHRAAGKVRQYLAGDPGLGP